MIAYEKLRALCQQMAEYAPIVRRANRPGSQRARDFIDIHVLVEGLRLDVRSPKALDITRQIFALKHVELDWLAQIEHYREFHRQGFLSVSIAGIAPEMASKLPRYPRLLVTLIGHLAVDYRVKGQGRGAFLFVDALRHCFEHATSVAAVAIMVDAKDEQAAAFYRHFRFLALQKDPRRL